MSEKNESQEQVTASNGEVVLNGLYAFKEGMSTIYSEQGEAIPVTVLRYDSWVVSQIKTEEKDGYTAIQVACNPKKLKNSTKAELGHFKKCGLEAGAQFVKEIRQALPEGLSLGQKVSMGSVKKGDFVKLTGTSRGRGFSGVVRRHNFAGGPGAHGSKFHRRPGSSGNRTWPGRVMPGKKFPGHFGDETITVRNVEIVGVLPEERVLLVKGPVPGSRNSLVKMVRE